MNKQPWKRKKTLQVLNTMINDLSKLNQTGDDRAGAAGDEKKLA